MEQFELMQCFRDIALRPKIGDLILSVTGRKPCTCPNRKTHWTNWDWSPCSCCTAPPSLLKRRTKLRGAKPENVKVRLDLSGWFRT